MILNHFGYSIYKLSSLLSIILIFGCGQPTINQTQDLQVSETHQPNQQKIQSKKKLYPEWFWNTPLSENSLYAVGYSEASTLHPEDSEKRAIEDGIKNLANLMSVNIDAEKKSLRGAGLSVIENVKEIENVDPKTEDLVRENYQVIKKFISSDYTLVLIKYGENDGSEAEISTGSAIIPPEPSWVTKLIKEPNYIYSVGESPLYFREIESWRSAEKKARIALAFTFESNVKEMTESIDDQMVTISSIATNINLNDIQIIARWKNEELNTCHVLIKMKDPTGVLWKRIEQ